MVALVSGFYIFIFFVDDVDLCKSSGSSMGSSLSPAAMWRNTQA